MKRNKASGIDNRTSDVITSDIKILGGVESEHYGKFKALRTTGVNESYITILENILQNLRQESI